MRIRIAGRGLAAGALALYALVVGVLLPLHAADGGPSAGGRAVAGAIAEGLCGAGDCHDPAHHHDAGSHDPTSCRACAQAKSLAAPVFAGHAARAVEAAGPAARRPASAPAATDLRARPPARAPPTLS